VGEEMQFDKAEFGAAPPPSCAGCQAELAGTYFEVDGHRMCPACREKIDAKPEGSPAGRFFAALAYGLGASVVGFVIYYAVLRLTGYEVGFIAIIVGLLVGLAVKKGSRGVGGAGYQALAIGLTYLSIVSTYVPLLADGWRQQNPGEAMSPLAYIVIVPYAFATPFLLGLKNIIGLFIIGFGLYEAWKINKRPKHDIRGPLELKAG
jgi:hypothetical protein